MHGLAGSMLAKSVHDAGWSQFISILSNKAECAGQTLVKLNPAATTQHCSVRGEHLPKTRAQRWHVPRLHPRRGARLNAAPNILHLPQGRGWGPGASGTGLRAESRAFGSQNDALPLV